MATKMITRTIKVYTYTTGKLNLQTMQVENVQNFEYPYKLGSRAKKDLEKVTGNPVIAETSGEALYGMSLDEFLRYAVPMNPDEAGEDENKDA